MAQHQRQEVLESYFLSRNQKSTTFSVAASTSDEIVAQRPTRTPTTSRVYWSPTHGCRPDKLAKIQTSIALVSSDRTDASESKSEIGAGKTVEDKCKSDGLHLPQIPSFNAYRLVDQQLVSVWHDEPKRQDELMMQQLLQAVSVADVPVIETPDVDDSKVISIPGIPDRCQPYRHRKASIDRTARENWILTQENKDAMIRHKKNWKKLEIAPKSVICYVDTKCSYRS